MKKFLNDPAQFVDEMIQGIVAAHPKQLKYIADDFRCIVRADEKKEGKVAIVRPAFTNSIMTQRQLKLFRLRKIRRHKDHGAFLRVLCAFSAP